MPDGSRGINLKIINKIKDTQNNMFRYLNRAKHSIMGIFTRDMQSI
ncbi:hypothetical protein GCM10023206_20280 [Acinetobacter puyangensis]